MAQFLIEHPFGTIMLTICVCLVIFMLGAVAEIVIKAIKGERKGSKDGSG